MLIRRFECPACGAPREALGDAFVLLCGYCGGLLALDSTGIFRAGNMADIRDRQLRNLIRPSRLEARKTHLTAEMQEAVSRRDRDRWRLACQEWLSLLALTDPEFVPARGRDPEILARWLSEGIALGQFFAFCEEAGRGRDRCAEACGHIGRDDDPVAAAREAIETYREFYDSILQHPDYPAGDVATPPEHLARQHVRTVVQGFATFLGPEGLRRVLVEVFGDDPAPEQAALYCDRCGARLEVPGDLPEGLKCPYCGSVSSLAKRPWLEQTMGLWNATLRDLLRRGQVTGPSVALSALALSMNPLWLGGSLDAESGYAFLREAVPWIPRADVKKAVRTYAAAFESESRKTAYLKALLDLLDGWTPEGQPPAPLPSIGGSKPLDEEEKTAWVEQNAALWTLTAGGGGNETIEERLLGFCLNAFHLGGSVDAGQAMTFFDHAEPAFDWKGMEEAVARFSAGFADRPDIAAFLSDLADILRGRAGGKTT